MMDLGWRQVCSVGAPTGNDVTQVQGPTYKGYSPD